MNRGQRRAKERGATEYVAPVIRNIKTEEVMLKTLYAPLLVLRDKYGFGKKRLGDFTEYLIDEIKALESGYVSLDDIAKVIKDETGIEIER